MNNNTINCVPNKERFSDSLNVKFEGVSKTPIKFSFNVESCLKPGFVSLTSGFNNNPDYDSIFILDANDALKLGEMLINAATDASKRRLVDHEAYIAEGKLSYMILKGWVKTIRIVRKFTRLDDYPSPKFYTYTFTAYGEDKKKPIYSYKVIMDLQFTSVSDFKYWLDCFSNGGKVKIYFDNYDPELEAMKEEEKIKDKIAESITHLNIRKDNYLPPLSEQIKSNYKMPKSIKDSDNKSKFKK